MANPQSDFQETGGQGGLSHAIHDDHHRRENLNMIRRAVKGRWSVSQHAKTDAPAIVENIMRTDVDPRVQIKAAEVLAMMDRDNISALIEMDERERLEVGDPTTVVGEKRIALEFDRAG